MMHTRTPQQESVVSELKKHFEIDTDRILFLNTERPEEPWIPADELMSIARQADVFQSIGESFEQYIPGLNQVVHIATVVDKSGRTISRTGVATVGEVHPVSKEVMDEHGLAATRALSAALSAAGFHPLRAGSVVKDLRLPSERNLVEDEAAARTKDLKQIHALATRKGLIGEGVGGNKDLTSYRAWLFEGWGTQTAATLNPTQRKSVINALDQMSDAESAIA